MSDYTIYHNPNCSKSRETLSLLVEHNIRPKIKEYLKDGFTESELREITSMIDPQKIVRTGQEEFIQKPFDLNDIESVIKGLLENPAIFQRPVVIYEGTALMCRPPSAVLSLIKD